MAERNSDTTRRATPRAGSHAPPLRRSREAAREWIGFQPAPWLRAVGYIASRLVEGGSSDHTDIARFAFLVRIRVGTGQTGTPRPLRAPAEAVNGHFAGVIL